MVKKVKTLSKHKKELDAIFSRYIRWRDKGQCYTCPKKDDPKNMQCGHFVPRQYLSVRFSEQNCHCQCYACNMLYNGQPSRYAQRLKEEYGDGIIDELERNRHTPVKLDAIWYEQKKEEYKRKLEAIS